MTALKSFSLATAASICLTAGLVGLFAPQARADDPYFAAGVQFYQKHDYKKAYGYFVTAGKNNPYDADNIYYRALTLQQLHDNKGAVKLYASLVSNFGYSNAGKLAANALSRLDPEYYRQLTKGAVAARTTSSASINSTGRSRVTTSSGSSYSDGVSVDYASLPADARVPYVKEGALLVVDANLNNRPLKMIFDTGAESCVFGKNTLREMGLAEPQGKSTGLSVGVGSSGNIETWTMPVTLKVGPIERKNFEISVQANAGTKPLLGHTFFRDYHVTVEKTGEENGTLHFVKKAVSGGSSTASSSRDLYAVPFQRAGKNLIVNVEVNGKPIQMFFDTGAANVAFTAEQLKKANISIPEDAQQTTTMGVGGETSAQLFNVNRIKMGPIEKTNFQVSCVGAAVMPYPLLGQSFYGDGWDYSIDSAANVIRFVRRR